MVKVLKVKTANSFFKSTIGLIGKERAEALLIHTRFGIHTFGLRFPIDIIVLDRARRIVQYKENLAPWKIYLWSPKHNLVLELPAGTIRKMGFKKGDVLELA